MFLLDPPENQTPNADTFQAVFAYEQFPDYDFVAGEEANTITHSEAI